MSTETILTILLVIFVVCCCFWYISCGCMSVLYYRMSRLTRSYRVFEAARLIPQEVDPIDLESN